MSKYNLTDILEGMSNDEFASAKEADRLEAHPDKDKIKAIQAMIAKEKESKNSVKEMTGEVFNRIDGLTNQVLKQQFLLKFSEIYEDMVEAGDMFDVSDVIQYLTYQMQEFAQDTKMDAGGMMEEEEMISKDRYDKLLDGAASRYEELENQFIKFIQDKYDKDFDMEDFRDFQGNISLEESNKVKSVNLREEIGPTGIAISQNQLDNLKKFGAIPGLEVMVQDKDGSNVRKVNYTLTNTNFEKDPDDIDDEFLKEHFGRFMKDYQ